MRKIKCKLVSIILLLLFTLGGCGQEGEILYFDRETVGDMDESDAMPESKGLQKTDISGEEQGSLIMPQERICVHVCGEVEHPGVVMLPLGSRAWEAVEAAGGLTESAEDASVNLAAVLQDGEKLYIPAIGEAVPEPEASEDSKLVNLNTADADRLQSLPGIGESRAADILAYREKNGGFHSVEEIMQVPGIKESTYEKLKDKITID